MGFERLIPWGGCACITGFRLFAVALLLCALCCSNIASAIEPELAAQVPQPRRNILFSSLSVKDGLAQISVNAIVQDRQGFMWFGTQEGLSRYNGYRFDNLFHDADDPDSLSHDWIWSLLVDRDGMIWVGTDGGGLDRYDPELGSFAHYTYDGTDANSLSNDRVRVIHQTNDGALWIGTDGGGLNRLDPAGRGFDRYRYDPEEPEGLPNDKVLTILEDRNGFLWVGTDGGLARLDPETGGFLVFRHDPSRNNSLSSDRIRALFEDSNGHIWIGTDGGGLNLFESGRGTFRRFLHNPRDPGSLSDNTVRGIYRDSFGTLWVGTSSGLNQWLPENESFICYRNDPTNLASLPDNRVRDIYQDRGGVLWVGTSNGVSRWNYVSDAFVYFSKTSNGNSYLNDKVVTTVDQSIDGRIWVGTFGGGLSSIDPVRGTATHFQHDPEDPNSLSSNVVMSVFVDRDNMVWVGTRKSGLNRLDPTTGIVRRYRHDASEPGSLAGDSVTRIHGDVDGTLWVATYGDGLSMLPGNSERFKVFRHDPQDPNSLSSDRVLSLYRDTAGTLWIGTENGGVNRMGDTLGSFTHYRHHPGDAESIGSDTAWEILEGRDGSLWIGTGGGGLNRWLPSDREQGRERFIRYGVQEGLLSNTVQGILQDDSGILWLSSNRGLTRLDPATGNVRHFDDRNALKSNDFTFGARIRGRDGALIFGGAEGLVVFHPERIRSNHHQPAITVTALGRLQALARSSNTSDDAPLIELNHTDYSITFDFAALDFNSPDKNRYQYRLKGFETDWNDPQHYRRATYTNLPPGTFRFEVNASNNDGVWSHTSAAIDLKVNPPPWRTNWAYASYAAAVFSCVGFFLYLQRKKRLRESKQRERLEGQVRERTQELAERNNELEELNDKLKDASMTDSLTGLKNRRYFYEFIETEVARIDRQAARQHGASGSLFFMMIDLDGFKAINDVHGHNAGDQALLQVRDILLRCCRSSDTVIRWGGDEFMIIGGTDSRMATERFAERLRFQLAEHDYTLGNGKIGHLSGSLGFALYPFVPDVPGLLHWETLTAIADQAAYIAKENQRNAWVGIYSQATAGTAMPLLGIRDDLEELAIRSLVEIKTSFSGELAVFKQQLKEAVVR